MFLLPMLIIKNENKTKMSNNTFRINEWELIKINNKVFVGIFKWANGRQWQMWKVNA